MSEADALFGSDDEAEYAPPSSVAASATAPTGNTDAASSSHTKASTAASPAEESGLRASPTPSPSPPADSQASAAADVQATAEDLFGDDEDDDGEAVEAIGSKKRKGDAAADSEEQGASQDQEESQKASQKKDDDEEEVDEVEEEAEEDGGDGVTKEDLFGDDDEEEEEAAAAGGLQVVPTAEQDEAKRDSQEQAETVRIVAVPKAPGMQVSVPHIPTPSLSSQLVFFNLPNTLRIVPEPFSPATYKPLPPTKHGFVLGADNVIRWRMGTDAAGNKIRESNARVVKWSDGSRQLLVGNEAWDITEAPIVDRTTKCPLEYLYAVRRPLTSGSNGVKTEGEGEGKKADSKATDDNKMQIDEDESGEKTKKHDKSGSDSDEKEEEPKAASSSSSSSSSSASSSSSTSAAAASSTTASTTTATTPANLAMECHGAFMSKYTLRNVAGVAQKTRAKLQLLVKESMTKQAKVRRSMKSIRKKNRNELLKEEREIEAQARKQAKVRQKYKPTQQSAAEFLEQGLGGESDEEKEYEESSHTYTGHKRRHVDMDDEDSARRLQSAKQDDEVPEEEDDLSDFVVNDEEEEDEDMGLKKRAQKKRRVVDDE